MLPLMGFRRGCNFCAVVDRPSPFRDVAGPELRGVLSGFIRPAVVGWIAGEIFDQFGRLALAPRVGRHRAIAFRQIASGDVRAHKVTQKAADMPPPDAYYAVWLT